MRQQTVLIFDVFQYRGSLLEQGLSSRGLHVFRTNQAREASKLLHLLQPHFLLISMEGEAQDFYHQFAKQKDIGIVRCIAITSSEIRDLRTQDIAISMDIPVATLSDHVINAIAKMNEERLPQVRTSTKESQVFTRQSTSNTADLAASAMAATASANPIHVRSEIRTANDSARSAESHSSALRELEHWEIQEKQQKQGPRTPTSDVASYQTQAHNTPKQIRPDSTAYATLPTEQHSTDPQQREWYGSLDKLDIARILAVLMRQQASGQLEFLFDREHRVIWLEKGLVLDAYANIPLRSVALLLVQDGIIKQSDIERYPELGNYHTTQQLLALKLIKPERVSEIQQLYAEQVIISCFSWEIGHYTFRTGVSAAIENPLHIDLKQIILQGVREGYTSERLLQLMGGADRVPQWINNRSPETFLPLQNIEKRILDQIDGRRSLNILHSTLRLEARMLYAITYVLIILGYLKLRETDTASLTALSTGDNPPYAHTPPPQPPASGFDLQQLFSTPSSFHNQPTVLLPVVSAANTDNIPNKTTNERTINFGHRSLMSTNRTALRPALQLRPEHNSPVRSPQEQISAEQYRQLREEIEQKFQQIMTQSYYHILELHTEASDIEIRRTYQQKKHHFNKERFPAQIATSLEYQLNEIRQVIEEAYAVLSDSLLRVQYTRNI